MRRKRKKDKSISVILFLIIIISIAFVFYILSVNNDKSNINKKSNNTKETTSKKNDKEETKYETKTQNTEPEKEEETEVKQEVQNNITVDIELIGDEEIILNVGDTYKELGVKALTSDGLDVSKNVTIDSNVDTTKEGEYMVIYSIGKSMVVRNVIVRR